MLTDSRLLFLDSDLFVLLAGTNLLRPLFAATGFDLASSRRLHPLPHMLHKGSLQRKYPEGVRQRAQAWCTVIPAIESIPSARTLDLLQAAEGIDVGEAFLLALVAEAELAVLATGDKKACRALGATASLAELRVRLRGKVLCLEEALRLLRLRLGYRDLLRALTPMREYSQTIRVLLSRGELTPEDSFCEALESYLSELSLEIGDLLFVGDLR